MKISKITIALLLALTFFHAAALAEANFSTGYPEWKVLSVETSGVLLLSDSPEVVPGEGITYQDTVSGHVRLFLYHVNGTAIAKKFAVLMDNAGEEAATVKVYKHGFAGPSINYRLVGKTALESYLQSTDNCQIIVPAHSVSELVDLSKVLVNENQLINGIYDFWTDKPVTVKVMMLAANYLLQGYAPNVEILPKDKERLRGTFTGRDRLIVPVGIYKPERDGAVSVTLADNEVDKYLNGIDATDGSKVVNYGNYGVMYQLFIPTEGKGDINYYLNPRGGEYGGVIGIRYQHSLNKDILVPADKLDFGGNNFLEYSFLGSFRAGESLWFIFSPPGASKLPVKLVIMP